MKVSPSRDPHSATPSKAARGGGDEAPAPGASAAGEKTPIFRILDVDGTADPKLDPRIPAEGLEIIYRTMVLNRLLDDRMLTLQRQGRIGFYLTSTGEEATHVASAYALEKTDWVFPAYREPGAALIRGFDLHKFICQLFGNAEDTLKGRQMPNHFSAREIAFVSISSPTGTQIPQAVGAAWAAKIRGDDMVAITYFGEGTTSQGDFHTALNFAGVEKVPVIFFCRNNQYAISVPSKIQTAAESIAVKAVAYGIEGIQVDGNDVLAVYEATRRARERARKGLGPTLIEGLTYRRGAHSSSDDPRRYREDSEVEEWTKKDPIDRLRRYMEKKGLIDAKKDEALRAVITEEIHAALERAEKVAPPPIESMFDDVFARIPWHLEREKREYLAWRAEHGAPTDGHGAH